MASIILQVEVTTVLTASQEAFRARYAGRGHTVTVIASGEVPAGGVDAHALIVNASGDAPPDITTTPRGFLVLTADAQSGPNVTSGSSFGFNNRGSSGAPAGKFGSGVVPRDTATTTSQQVYETSQPIYYYTDATWSAGAVPVLAAHSITTTRWAGGYIPTGGALQDGTAAPGPRGWWLPTNLHLMVEAAWVILDNLVAYLLVPPVANVAPTVNAGPDVSVLLGEPYTRQATGSDPDGTIVEWVWRATQVPPGATTKSTYNASTGLFTPNADVLGTWTYEVRGRDEVGAWSAWDAFVYTATAPTEFTGGPVEPVVGTTSLTEGILRSTTGPNQRTVVRRATAEGSPDHSATVTVTEFTGDATNQTEVLVGVRVAADSQAGFWFGVDSRRRWNLLKVAADGTDTTLASDWEYTVPPGRPLTVRLDAAGSSAAVFVNGVQVGAAALVGHESNTRVGIRMFPKTDGVSVGVNGISTTTSTPGGGTGAPAAPIPYLTRRGYTSALVEAEPVDGADRYLLQLDGRAYADSAAPQFDVAVGLYPGAEFVAGMAAVNAAGQASGYTPLTFRTWPRTGREVWHPEEARFVPLVRTVWDSAVGAFTGGPQAVTPAPVTVPPLAGLTASVVTLSTGGQGVRVVPSGLLSPPRFRLTEPGGHDAIHDGTERTSGRLAEGPYTYTAHNVDEAGNQSTGVVANTVTVGPVTTDPTSPSTDPGTDVTPTMDYPTTSTYNVATIGKQVITGLWTPPGPGEYTDIVFGGDKNSGQVYFPESFPGKVTLRRCKFLWGEPGLKGPLQNVAVVRNRSAYRHDIIDFEFDGQVRRGDTRTWGGARDGTAFMGKFFLLRGEIHDFSEGIRVAGDSIYRDLHIFGGVPCYDTLRDTMSHVDCFQVSGGENWLIDRCKAIDLNPAGALEPTMMAALMVGSGDSTNPAQGVVRDSFLDGGQVVINLMADGTKSTGTRTPRVHFDNVTVGDRCYYKTDQVKAENPTYHTGTIRDWRTGRLVFNNPV